MKIWKRKFRWAAPVLLLALLVYEVFASAHSSARLSGWDLGLIIFLFMLTFGLLMPFVPLLRRLTKVSVGGVSFEIDRIKDTQRRQQDELDALRFLMRGYVNKGELSHLEKLNGSDAFPFECWEVFLNELRHLRQLGLIDIVPAGFTDLPEDKRTSADETDLPDKGDDLRTYFRITDWGKTYLNMRTSF